ncbi:divisome protein SepX/GlpR [Wenjunlia tyrosinilytica]|uniref:Uncharacterized protein n=1 Tax=Wenjunlia tyrosinilytica TaxID=1544741 RepID=A0A917ZRW2_9ACTN|nr:hypothetical protein [Wenjunlia tyrosinilytica]GGO88508.1 hypothetical protein GCM10012280_29500 [Wenjunlia tyrosinilytica]
MSSSGLIYAVIVGAWAAYLVPMWLRRQDELNEARPTERFSTAIRLLSGRAAMERRYAKSLDENEHPEHPENPVRSEHGDESPAAAESVDVRALAVPVRTRPAPAANSVRAPGGLRRAQVLARRRRTTSVLFLAFTAGAVGAGVGGLALLWLPLVPGALLTMYIVHLRRQEHRRFEVRLDQRRAAEAARRVREQRKAVPAAAPAQTPPPPAPQPDEADTAARRAVVEETDHAEWVDGLQRRPADQDGWDPVPVPLPTYVTAPVAPRSTGTAAAGAPETWTAPGPPEPAQSTPTPARRSRERGSTPLFDQYANEHRPRAANE